jgi:hypothetical protein
MQRAACGRAAATAAPVAMHAGARGGRCVQHATRDRRHSLARSRHRRASSLVVGAWGQLQQQGPQDLWGKRWPLARSAPRRRCAPAPPPPPLESRPPEGCPPQLLTPTPTPPDAATDYDGSSVVPMPLPVAQTLHRRSFGHRNQRTYALVVYDPAAPACAAAENGVEALASGLRHEASLVSATCAPGGMPHGAALAPPRQAERPTSAAEQQPVRGAATHPQLARGHLFCLHVCTHAGGCCRLHRKRRMTHP